MIKVTYIDHSGFAISTPGAIMVFDFYKDPDKKLHKLLAEEPDKEIVFFVSHHHPDHFNKSIFELAQNRRTMYVLSYDIYSRLVPDKGLQTVWMSPGDRIESVPGTKSVQAFRSTDEGVAFAITLEDGRVIFHAGDLNDWHWSEESNPGDIKKAHEAFLKIAHRVADEFPEIYVAMFPVDARQGTDFAHGATEFLKAVKVDNFFPMHFWGEPQKACDFSSYVPAGSATKCYCLDQPGQEVTLD